MRQSGTTARSSLTVILSAAVAAGSLFSTAGTTRAVSAPPNDFFAFATVVSSLPYTDAAVDSSLATKEASEPLPSCSAPGASTSNYGNSVWYKFVAAADATLSAKMAPANTVSNTIYPVLTAYEGTSLGTLVDLGCAAANVKNAKTALPFPVESGKTYYIRAASNSNASSGGIFDFTLDDASAPPPPSSLAWKLLTGRAITPGSLPVTFTWVGKAGVSPIAHYDVETRVDSGAWSAPVSQATASRTVNCPVPSHTCQVRVQAVDTAGRHSTWATSTKASPAAYQQTSSAIHYRGTWKTVSSGSFSGGSARRATAKGAWATFTFTGRSVAWVGLKCPSCGSVKVYVRTGSGAYVYVATVNTYAATSAYRRFTWAKTWSSSRTRTIKLVVQGTSGHPRVYVDLFAKLQ